MFVCQNVSLAYPERYQVTAVQMGSLECFRLVGALDTVSNHDGTCKGSIMSNHAPCGLLSGDLLGVGRVLLCLYAKTFPWRIQSGIKLPQSRWPSGVLPTGRSSGYGAHSRWHFRMFNNEQSCPRWFVV